MYNLNVSISEVKDLVLEGTTGDISTFVVLNLENLKKRTRSVKGTNPLWAENYMLQLSDPSMSKLKVSLWTEGTKDKMVSHCEIPLDITVNTSKEEWYDLVYANSSSYVSGEIHVRIDCHKLRDAGVLSVDIVEGRNLPLRTKTPQDFLVKVSMGKSSQKTKNFRIQEKSKAGHQSLPSEPEWNETLDLKLNSDDILCPIVFTVYRNKITGLRPVGQCTILPQSYLDKTFIDEWLLLEGVADTPEKDKKKGKKIGSIRLSLKLSKAIVHHIDYYTPLVEFLMDSEKGVTASVAVLEKTIQASEDRSSVATCLVRIYESRNKAPMILKALLTSEISNASNTETLFRANSLASKSVDMYMKISCYHYLQHCIQGLIDSIYKETLKGKSCELDGPDAKKNWKYLQKLLDTSLDKIYRSIDSCPSDLRDIFYHIQNQVQEKFLDDKLVQFTSVSGFLFLRFICPAILGPKLFDLAADHPIGKTATNLKQVAKIIQRIANMGPTNTSTTDPILHECEMYIEGQKIAMKRFLNQISKPNPNSEFFNPASVDLQQELSHMQEHCEKNIASIIQLYSEGTEISDSAKKLLCILDEMNKSYGSKRPPALIEVEGRWVVNPDFVPLSFEETIIPVQVSPPAKTPTNDQTTEKRKKRLKTVISESKLSIKGKRKVEATPERTRSSTTYDMDNTEGREIPKSLTNSPMGSKKTNKKVQPSVLEKRKTTD